MAMANWQMAMTMTVTVTMTENYLDSTKPTQTCEGRYVTQDKNRERERERERS